jgi:hypothetical protein
MGTRTTLGGAVKAQLGKRTAREIKVDHEMVDPAGIANLAALVAGEYGGGPFWWVDPWAQVTNLLTPAASVLEVGTWRAEDAAKAVSAASVLLADGGRAGRSIVVGVPSELLTLPRRPTASGWPAADNIPVLPGKPVTASVYASGTAVDVRMQWLDAAGTSLGSQTARTAAPGAIARRCSVTGVPPEGAASCYVAVTGANVIARPAVTWTARVMPWHVGQGMPRVVVAAIDEDPALASIAPGRQWAASSYTVTEVG